MRLHRISDWIHREPDETFSDAAWRYARDVSGQLVVGTDEKDSVLRRATTIEGALLILSEHDTDHHSQMPELVRFPDQIEDWFAGQALLRGLKAQQHFFETTTDHRQIQVMEVAAQHDS